MAAVYPAGPDPMMIRSRTPSCSAGGIAGFVISPVVTAGPGGGEAFTRGNNRVGGGAGIQSGRAKRGSWGEHPLGPRPEVRREPASGEEDGILSQPAAWTVTS